MCHFWNRNSRRIHNQSRQQRFICVHIDSLNSVNTPISRSRHFDIESEAPVGRNPEVLPLITGAAMSYCCVPGCTSYQRKECDKELSFHHFPIIIYFFFLQNSSWDSTSFIGSFFDICNIKSR